MYRYFDLSIDSSIPLPELPEVNGGEASISFQLVNSPLDSQVFSTVHHWQLPDGEITMTCARSGEDYLLEFPDLAEFEISGASADVRCYPRANVDSASIRHLLLDQVIPRVIGHGGDIVLHASAVVIGGKAAAFLGAPGSGKSTLAASFLMSDCPMLTDDCLLIKTKASDIVGIRGCAGLRLLQDSIDAIIGEEYESKEAANYSSKRRLTTHVDSKQKSEIPIAAAFLLTPPADAAQTGPVELEQIDGARTVTELIKHSYILDVSDKARIAEKFSATGNIVASGLPVYRLTYPHKHALLAQIRAVVEEVVTG